MAARQQQAGRSNGSCERLELMLRISFVGVVGCVFANYARRQHSLSILQYERYVVVVLRLGIVVVAMPHANRGKQAEAKEQTASLKQQPQQQQLR